MNLDKDSVSLLARLKILEDRCRSLRLGLIVCSLSTALSLLLGFLAIHELSRSRHRVLEAKAFVVRDAEGHEAIRIGMSGDGTPIVVLRHSGGGAALGVSLPHSPFLRMSVVSGIQASLGVDAGSEREWKQVTPYLRLGTSSYPDSLNASVLPDGSPSLRLKGSRSQNALILSLWDLNAMRAALAWRNQDTDIPEHLHDFIRQHLGRDPEDVPSIHGIRGNEVAWSIPPRPAR
jgi:hypothetical protein